MICDSGYDFGGLTPVIATTDADGKYQFEVPVDVLNGVKCYLVFIDENQPALSGLTHNPLVDDTPENDLPTQQINRPLPLAVAVEANANYLQIDFGFIQEPVAPAIMIEKSTNGEDADTAPGPVLAIGSPVTWTYVVTNTGNVALTNVIVTDDQLDDSAIDCGDGSNMIGELDVGAEASCTAQGTAQAGQYANLGSVTGMFEETEVTDSDHSHYFGETSNGGGQGCTPGYWRQPHHFGNWTAPYTPDTLFSDVFEDAFPGKTLLEVVVQGGGGLIALGRHTVAALLNAASDGVSYDLSVQQVIDGFNAVYPGGNYNAQKDIFENFNEQGCPLGRNPGEVEPPTSDPGPGKGKGKG